eukprot:13047857-Heterocapsa_arctica.AAC.1
MPGMHVSICFSPTPMKRPSGSRTLDSPIISGVLFQSPPMIQGAPSSAAIAPNTSWSSSMLSLACSGLPVS